MPLGDGEEGRSVLQGRWPRSTRASPTREAALYKHLTTNPKIKIDGKEETHESLKTKNDAEIKNVIAYILSR